MSDLRFENNLINVGLWKRDTGENLLPQNSYELRSVYVETFWLPILGPSTIFFLRFLARKFRVAAAGEGLILDLKETAQCIGLSDRLSCSAPMIRTIARCIDFDIAKIAGPDTLLVRNFLPPLSRRQQNHLPPSLLNLYKTLDDNSNSKSPNWNSAVAKSRDLALMLIKTGLNESDCEQHLLSKGLHPSLVRETVCFAKKQLQSEKNWKKIEQPECSADTHNITGVTGAKQIEAVAQRTSA